MEAVLEDYLTVGLHMGLKQLRSILPLTTLRQLSLLRLVLKALMEDYLTVGLHMGLKQQWSILLVHPLQLV